VSLKKSRVSSYKGPKLKFGKEYTTENKERTNIVKNIIE